MPLALTALIATIVFGYSAGVLLGLGLIDAIVNVVKLLSS
jgi:hypothetical protein